MSTTIREQVIYAAGVYAAQYPTYVDGVVNAINEAGSVEAGKDYLRSIGGGDFTYLLDSVTIPTGDHPSEPGDVAFIEHPSLDRVTAAEVIRAFLAEYHREVDIDALLILAGLEDEPAPVFEDDDDVVDPGLFARLVSFARGHGFSG